MGRCNDLVPVLLSINLPVGVTTIFLKKSLNKVFNIFGMVQFGAVQLFKLISLI